LAGPVPVDVSHLEVLEVPAERAIDRCHGDTVRSAAARGPASAAWPAYSHLRHGHDRTASAAGRDAPSGSVASRRRRLTSSAMTAPDLNAAATAVELARDVVRRGWAHLAE